MPVDTSCNFRFMNSNLLAGSLPARTYSSETTGFEFANALTSDRTDYWKPDSYFLIDSTNNKIYINDGADKTATITAGDYTGATLATEIQTQLNTVSSNFTVSYTSSYGFNISNSGSITLRLSEDTNAAWETIGFVSGIDTSGTNLDADEQRNHWPYQWVKCDFGYQASIGFLGIISALPDAFPMSSVGTVTIEANNIDDFTSPPLSETATITKAGVFKFLDDVDSSYRYWRLKIYDPYYSGGPNIQIGNIYLGEYEQFTARNISPEFSYSIVDRSEVIESKGGKLYFDTKDKFYQFEGLEAALLDKTNRLKTENLFKQVGISSSFYIAIDPKQAVSNSIEEFTHYVFFSGAPSFTHVFSEYFTARFNLREAF